MTPLKQAHNFGYQEARLGPGEWEVTYFGVVRRVSPGDAQETQVQQAIQRSRELALWRAAQIALRDGKKSFDVIRERVATRIHREPGYYPHPFPPYHYRRPYAYPIPYGYYEPPSARGRAWVTLRVRLYGKRETGRFKARHWQSRMAAKYGVSITEPEKPGTPKT